MADEPSILKSVKQMLDIPVDVTDFDLSIMTHINSAFLALSQLGIGPKTGFAIAGDATTWDTFLGDDLRLNSVKSYIFLKVKTLFDPPGTASLQEANKALIQEFEWRLNVVFEETGWVDPTPTTDIYGYDEDLVLDGGTA